MKGTKDIMYFDKGIKACLIKVTFAAVIAFSVATFLLCCSIKGKVDKLSDSKVTSVTTECNHKWTKLDSGTVDEFLITCTKCGKLGLVDYSRNRITYAK